MREQETNQAEQHSPTQQIKLVAGTTRAMGSEPTRKLCHDVQVDLKLVASSLASDRIAPSTVHSVVVQQLAPALHVTLCGSRGVQDAAAATSGASSSPSGQCQALAGVVQRFRQVVPPATAALHLCAPSGAPGAQLHEARELRLVIPGVLCASIVLAAAGSAEAVHVGVMDALQAPRTDVTWAPPVHQVFRVVSAVAVQALGYFKRQAGLLQQWKPVPQPQQPAGEQQQQRAAAALECLLLWLTTYRDLFRKPCAATGKVLALDAASQALLPPVFRPFQLSLEQLQQQAAPAAACPWRAFHLQAVPDDLVS